MRERGVEGRAGSCGTYDDELAPRTAQRLAGRGGARPCRRCGSSRARCASRAWRGRAARPPTVVLPEPDSPTRPTISPGASSSAMSSTISPPCRQLDAQARDAQRAHASSPPPTPATARETPSVMKFVPIAKSAMQAAGRDDRPRLQRDRRAVLVDHQAPVRVRRLDPEAEEADRGDHGDRPGEAQAVLDHQRRRDVRQDLAERGSGGAADRSPRPPGRTRDARCRRSRRAPRARPAAPTRARRARRSARDCEPSIETNSSTSTICGKARMTSIKRISASSSRDREKPASMPTPAPTPTPSVAAANAIQTTLRPPQSSRERTSWPR